MTKSDFKAAKINSDAKSSMPNNLSNAHNGIEEQPEKQLEKQSKIGSTPTCPCTNNTYPKIVLKAGKESSLYRFHPWIFSGAIDGTLSPKGLEEGDTVSVYSSTGSFLAIGQLSIGSIAIRILSFEDVHIDLSFYKQRIASAYLLRKNLNLIRKDQNIYRLVHGEGDNLPGLIVDIYNKTAVVQAHTIGVHLHRQLISEALLSEVDGLEQIYYKSEGTLPYMANIDRNNEYLHNTNVSNTHTDKQALENGINFLPNWMEGQKTGFFIDQRENRALVGEHSKGKKVLNMFCYTGGFSMYALQAEAELVHSVDSSAKAIALTDAQVEINFGEKFEQNLGQNLEQNLGEDLGEAKNLSDIVKRHKSFTTDAFDYLEEMPENFYDLIILDPPAFAKHLNVVKQALQAYKKINAKAIRKITPGGLLFTFSCSQAVSKEQFRQAIFSAAVIAKRKVRILKQLSQGDDHPVNIYHPEGEYLKGLMLYVE